MVLWGKHASSGGGASGGAAGAASAYLPLCEDDAEGGGEAAGADARKAGESDEDDTAWGRGDTMAAVGGAGKGDSTGGDGYSALTPPGGGDGDERVPRGVELSSRANPGGTSRSERDSAKWDQVGAAFAAGTAPRSSPFAPLPGGSALNEPPSRGVFPAGRVPLLAPPDGGFPAKYVHMIPAVGRGAVGGAGGGGRGSGGMGALAGSGGLMTIR